MKAKTLCPICAELTTSRNETKVEGYPFGNGCIEFTKGKEKIHSDITVCNECNGEYTNPKQEQGNWEKAVITNIAKKRGIINIFTYANVFIIGLGFAVFGFALGYMIGVL